MHVLPFSDSSHTLYRKFDEVFQKYAQRKDWTGSKVTSKGQEEETNEQLEMLRRELAQFEDQRDRILAEEMQPLLLEARATAFKRTPEMREKIVSLQLDDLLSHETKILQEYIEFMSRHDIQRIEATYPEIFAWKNESLILLKLAWEKLSKYEKEKPARRISPEDHREKELQWIVVKAKDKAETKMALLKVEIEEKLKLRKFQKEAEKMITANDDLTEEEKEEMKEYAREMGQVLMNKGDEAQTQELM